MIGLRLAQGELLQLRHGLAGAFQTRAGRQLSQRDDIALIFGGKKGRGQSHEHEDHTGDYQQVDDEGLHGALDHTGQSG
ncbi:hypothetical protein SDC9_150672 [bioreactor metagenome]|uniref:Uncharacterized protein n=1 Tax=bioreactor metagenome TaxID=1076179 RepID=A0A645EQ96_9ZZZZ